MRFNKGCGHDQMIILKDFNKGDAQNEKKQTFKQDEHE